MNLKLPLVFVVVNIIWAGHCSGQVINLKSALELAGKNYPSLRAKDAGRMASAYHLRSVQLEGIPDVIASHQFQYSTSNGLVGSLFPYQGTTISTSGGIRPENVYQGVWGSFTSLIVDWNFFNFGQVKTDKQIAANELSRDNADYENEVFQHKVKVADAYLSLLALEKLVEVQEKNLERAESFFQMTKAYSLSGIKAGVDSSVAMAEVSKARLLLIESRENSDLQKSSLASLIGITDTFTIDSSLFFSSTPQVPATDSTVLSNSRPLRFYSTEVNLLKSQAEAVRISYLPSFHLFAAGWARGSGIGNTGDVMNSGLINGIRYKTYNYMFGIGVMWNISNIPRVRQEFEGESYLPLEARYYYDEVYLLSKQGLRDAQIEEETARQAILESPVQLRAAEDAYVQSKARYDAGLSTFPEISQSLYVLSRAESDQVAAYINSWKVLLKEAAAAGDMSLFTIKLK